MMSVRLEGFSPYTKHTRACIRRGEVRAVLRKPDTCSVCLKLGLSADTTSPPSLVRTRKHANIRENHKIKKNSTTECKHTHTGAKTSECPRTRRPPSPPRLGSQTREDKVGDVSPALPPRRVTSSQKLQQRCSAALSSLQRP